MNYPYPLTRLLYSDNIEILLYHIKIQFYLYYNIRYSYITDSPCSTDSFMKCFFKMSVHEDEEDSWKRLHRNVTFATVL